MPRPDRSRAALVDSAATLFRRQGYAATGMNQILAAADVKAGSLYHHFPDGKAELAAAVVEHVGGDIERLLRATARLRPPPVDIVERLDRHARPPAEGDPRDGCPIEPIATESVHGSAAGARSIGPGVRGWCAAVADRLRVEGWSTTMRSRPRSP